MNKNKIKKFLFKWMISFFIVIVFTFFWGLTGYGMFLSDKTPMTIGEIVTVLTQPSIELIFYLLIGSLLLSIAFKSNS